jgi:hypothetical protein
MVHAASDILVGRVACHSSCGAAGGILMIGKRADTGCLRGSDLGRCGGHPKDDRNGCASAAEKMEAN